MKRQLKFDITEEMMNKIKKICEKEIDLSPNQYIANKITEYVLATKASKKLNDNRFQIIHLLKEELTPIKERYERIMDRIEEDYVFIREGINDGE